MYWEGALTIAIAILFIIIIKEKPEKPPSKLAEHAQSD